jgi:hypothetical protein
MAKNTDAPANSPAAPHRKPQGHSHNLMEPGSGTPWEDRGSVGFVGAFFKTAFAAMFAPRRLLTSMRRPETASDARILCIVYGVFWGLGWVHNDVMAWRHSGDDFDMTVHGYAWIIHFALGVAGTFFVLQFGSALFYKLISAGEMKAKVPRVLVYNVFVYCLGPSILALIPFGIGPLVALLWIFGLFMFAATSRLGVNTGNAIVCTLIGFGVILGGAVLAYLALRWFIGWLELFPTTTGGGGGGTPAPRRL